jgi:uncharacterized delta-60 repeat protein
MKHFIIRSLTTGAFVTAFLTAPGAAHAQTPGQLDQDFGVGGRLTVDFNGGSDVIYALAPLKDGRFLAAGDVHGRNAQGPGSTGNFSVSRFLPDGRLDPGFATDGTFEMDLDGGFDEAHAIALLPDRSIILAGRLSQGAYADFGVVKLTPDGALDTTFGRVDAAARLGWNRMEIGGAGIHDDPVGVAIQRNGKIIVVGKTSDEARYARVAVARFTADGQPDLSFGGNGTGFVILPGLEAQRSDYPTAIALDSRNKLAANDAITLVGYTTTYSEAFVIRLTADGAMDTTFGATAAGGGRTGRLTLKSTASGGVYQGASMLASARLVAGNKIVLLGLGGDRGFTFIRLNNDGSLDTTFGTNGRTLVKFSGGATEDIPHSLAVQANGRLVAAGFALSTATGAPRDDFFVARLNADGSPDNSFGDGQARAVVQVAVDRDRAQAIQVEPSGNLLVGGFALRPNTSQTDYALIRLHGDPDRIGYYDFELPRD